jgi:hypothetical protein
LASNCGAKLPAALGYSSKINRVVGAVEALEPSEHRRDPRVKVTLRGRYMLADGHEYPCRTVDISAGGVAIVGTIKGKIGERVVVYLDRVGRIEGTIVRHFDGCFAITLRVSPLKREALSAEVARLVKEQTGRAIEAAALRFINESQIAV